VSSAVYRILSPAGEQREDGSADVKVADGALVLAPTVGAVLRVPFGQIVAVSEPEPFTVRVTLADGNAIDLSRLGVMRTQLLAELRDGRGDDAASAAAAVGEAAMFSGLSGGEPAEIRVYDDLLLVLGSAGSDRISFSFVDEVRTQDYAVTVKVAGRSAVVLSRLGRRTDELAKLLADRLTQARGRTAAFLGSLLPGLDPMALRQAADLLRDGIAVPAATLNAIHPDLAGTLLQIVTLPARRDSLAELAKRTDLAIGFKQLASVHRPATGATPWHDHAATPHIGQHDSPGGTFRPGLPGMLAAEAMSSGPQLGPAAFAGPGGFPGAGGFPGTSPGGFAGPGDFPGAGPGGFPAGGGFPGPGGIFGFGEGYAAYGNYWAFRALGAGLNPGQQQRQMAQRPDVTRGLLTPETEDLSALTATGQEPTVLAFVLGCHPGRVVYEVLNHPEPVTYVYQADGADALAAFNRALDDAGFQPAAVHAEGPAAPARPSAASSPLTASLLAQVPHDPQWRDRIAELLTD